MTSPGFCVVMGAIAPSAWGPAFWRFLHTLAYQMNDHLLPKFGEMVHTLVRAIPCDECRTHALRYVESHRPPTTRNAVVMYVQHFHNVVNRRLLKPSYTLLKGARAHAQSDLASRASAVVRRLKRTVPGRCATPLRAVEVELSSRDAVRRIRDLAEGIALIQALVLQHFSSGGRRRRRRAAAPLVDPRDNAV